MHHPGHVISVVYDIVFEVEDDLEERVDGRLLLTFLRLYESNHTRLHQEAVHIEPQRVVCPDNCEIREDEGLR